jgi:hypothetical protein
VQRTGGLALLALWPDRGLRHAKVVRSIALLGTFLNLRTAKALGVTIPRSFILRAERIIE